MAVSQRRHNFIVIFKLCVRVCFKVLRLTQKEQVLEERLESVCQENTELRASLASLHTRLALHDQLNQQQSQQVHSQAHETHAHTHTHTHTGQHNTAQRCLMNERKNNKGIFCSGSDSLGFSGIVESIAKQSAHPRHCNLDPQVWIPLMFVWFLVGPQESGTSGFPSH